MAIAIGNDAVVRTSNRFSDVCSTLFDADHECPAKGIKTIAPLASYLLTYPSLLSYVLQNHQPESITRTLHLCLMLSYYGLGDKGSLLESFNQCVEFGAKIGPRMSFPGQERQSKENTDFKENILETLAFQLLERDYSPDTSVTSRLSDRKRDH